MGDTRSTLLEHLENEVYRDGSTTTCLGRSGVCPRTYVAALINLPERRKHTCLPSLGVESARPSLQYMNGPLMSLEGLESCQDKPPDDDMAINTINLIERDTDRELRARIPDSRSSW